MGGATHNMPCHPHKEILATLRTPAVCQAWASGARTQAGGAYPIRARFLLVGAAVFREKEQPLPPVRNVPVGGQRSCFLVPPYVLSAPCIVNRVLGKLASQPVRSWRRPWLARACTHLSE
eukprot:544618-Rhodomonas_salina.3